MLSFTRSTFSAASVVAFLATGLAVTPSLFAGEPTAAVVNIPMVADTSAVNGDVASAIYNKATNDTLIALTDASGTRLWETTISGMNALPLFDAAGNLFYKSETNVMSMDSANGSIKWSFARPNPINGEHIYYIETYGNDVFVSYGIQPVRYPAMGIVHLNAESGAQLWDIWVGTTVTFRGVENGQLVTSGPFASGPFYYSL